MLSTMGKWTGAIASLLVALASPAGATILTFEPNGTFADQDYGDRVASANQDDPPYIYNLTGGITPNIEVGYDFGALYWGDGYGDLDDVLFEVEDTPAGFELTLTADPGFEVALRSFDMGGWSSADYTINSVTVVDGSDNTLFSEQDVLIHGAGPSHTSFDFGEGLVAPMIKIRFDAANLSSNSPNIGIDNVKFSQPAVPEPTSGACLLVLGGAALLRRRGSSCIRPLIA